MPRPVRPARHVGAIRSFSDRQAAEMPSMGTVTILERRPRVMPAAPIPEPDTSRLSLALSRTAGTITLSNTKMPGSTFSTDPTACHVGRKLHKVAGSVCKSCYAIRLMAWRPNLRVSYPRNLALARAMLAEDVERWARYIAHQIAALAMLSGEPFHRWFDAGDIDSLDMLRGIVRVAELLPEIRFWLPTREVRLVRAYLRNVGQFPSNLVVRISAPMVDGPPLPGWSHTSTVHKARALGPVPVRGQRLVPQALKLWRLSDER
jgi:hypothetical protein